MADEKAINPKIFGAYDVRGIYPDTLDEDVAYRIGRAFVQYLNVRTVAVGRDMRISSPALAGAVMRGITDQGADAIDLGMTTTDELYFAVGKFDYPAGIMVTASHNPKQYNGLKWCREDAIAISSESGGNEIRDLALAGSPPEPASKGQVIQRDVTDDYVRHVFSFIDVAKIRSPAL
jgi:phosphomannomutase